MLVKTNEYNDKLKSIDYSTLNDKDNYIINYFLNNFIDTKTDSKYKVISLLFLITPIDAKNHSIIENMFTENFSINKELLHKWKENLNIDLKMVDKIVKLLILYIDEHFEKIIETKAIKEYDYCALVIALLKEYDSDKQNYYKKYITIAKNRETFKKCLKKYKEG